MFVAEYLKRGARVCVAQQLDGGKGEDKVADRAPANDEDTADANNS